MFVVISFSSCQKELENWYSETASYDGRFIFKLMSEDMNETIVDYGGYEIQIYNTAENVPNVVWMDDHEDMFPLKNKFELTGNASSFKSATEDFTQLSNNIYSTDVLPTPAPTAAGQTVTKNKGYIRTAVLEGKIIPGAAKSIGGNASDSLYIKIKLYSGTATYTSYEVAKELRADPKVPEFKWKFSSATRDPELDEVYVIGGYRYTGMPEDQF